MKVILSSHFQGYTDQRAEVEARGTSLRALMAGLDKQFPGIRFRLIDEQDRIRPHVCVFVNGERVEALATRLKTGDQVHLLGSLSGG